MQDLVSIIVPVYNTANKLLKKCINSLITQTFSNIEIIIVDDGSELPTALFCDSLALSDSRIKVIHKENGGLSSARNAGIDCAKGNLYSFVDSDDYIHAESIQRMYDAKSQSNCVIVCMRDIIIDEEGKIIHHFGNDTSLVERISWERYLKSICEKKLSESVCDKLFSAELFRNRRFESGRLNEDFLFLSQLLMSGVDIALLDFAGYYYLKHEGTITANRTNYASLQDAIRNSCELAELALSGHPTVFLSFVYSALFQTKVLLSLLKYNPKDISDEWRFCLTVLSKYKQYINKCNLKSIDKFLLIGFYKCPSITKSLYKLIKK